MDSPRVKGGGVYIFYPQDPHANLQLRLSSEDFAALQEVVGESIAGDWTLQVRDQWEQDTARLDQWALEIDYETTEVIERVTSSPNLAIPDANTTGVQSQLSVSAGGPVQALRLEGTITHTYRGDLQIELVAPDGQRAPLRRRDNDSSPNLQAIYESQQVSTLGALLGVASAGTWRLHVRDLARRDEGALDSWALEGTR